MLRCPPDLSISRPPLAPLPSFRVLSALLSRSKAVSSRSFMSLMPPAGRKESSKGLSPTFSTQATYHLFEKPSSGRQNPVLKDQDHLPSQNNLAKSCHLTDTQPSKDSPSTTHMILPVGLVIVTAYYAPQIIITFVNSLALLTVVPTIHLQVIWSLNVRGPWCKV